MTDPRDNQGERLWRWTLRIMGSCAFILSGVLLILQRDIPVVFLLWGAGCMGLDSIQGFEVRRRRNGR
jgi:hypothetical protein